MNNYTYHVDNPKGLARITYSWWTLVALGVATWVGTWVAWGGDTEETLPRECVTHITQARMWDWVYRLGGWVDFDGATNLWYDASGRVVGSSETEDSEICSFVK